MRKFNNTKVHYHENERDKENDLKTYITSEEAFNKAVKKATDAKEELPVLIASQNFAYRAAETVGEALQLSGVTQDVEPIDKYITDQGIDISAFLSTFNETAGILKQHNEAADQLRDTNFASQDGEFDLGYAVAQKSEGRSKQSSEQKAAKALGVSMEQLQAALAMIRQQAAGTSTVASAS